MSEEVFITPPIFAFLCYFAGTAVFLAALSWLIQGDGRLREAVGRWLLRVLVLITIFSLVFTAVSDAPIAAFLPEVSLLFFIVVLYLKLSHIKNFPSEAIKVIGVGVACGAAWGISFALGWTILRFTEIFVPELVWFPALAVGLLWNGALFLLYARAKKNLPPDFKPHHLLLAAVLAYLLLMLPMVLEAMVNAPKFQEMLHAVPRLQRA